ncbi:hypothetical protein DVDV_3957 [Desulfovibrio sp. DV]|uniref:hypothetical protein n=1 Tax=Desulfovibrio sp. DV TaxID=1844708 RepID=UPI00094BBADF|nr:hypothetical protein [Desulfovibrio sp. DV]OLN24748.1 hypothetical protein DVDV_3957 [Desulfovibrio sp. DV]
MGFARRLLGLVVAVSLVASSAALAQTARDPGREAMLQTIGMLAGQGLVLGHEALAGLAARYEKGLVSREQAGRVLADMGRYAELVAGVFKDRLMGRLGPEERRDLGQLIGFYEVERECVAALAAFVGGEAKNRAAFDASMERLSGIIRQISLGQGAP